MTEQENPRKKEAGPPDQGRWWPARTGGRTDGGVRGGGAWRTCLRRILSLTIDTLKGRASFGAPSLCCPNRMSFSAAQNSAFVSSSVILQQPPEPRRRQCAGAFLRNGFIRPESRAVQSTLDCTQPDPACCDRHGHGRSGERGGR